MQGQAAGKPESVMQGQGRAAGKSEGAVRRRRTGCNRTLYELMCGIVLFELVCFFAGIWFVPRKGFCALGLFLGMLTAFAMAYHMSWTFDRYLGLAQKQAARMVTLQALIRYFAVAAVLFTILFTKIANPLTAFLGIMGLKIGAYLQPLIHSFTVKKYPDPEPAPPVPDWDE